MKTALSVAVVVVALSTSLVAQAAATPAWVGRLQADLARVDAHNRADIGVFVRDLNSGASTSYRADETWYLASTVKLPVALTVLRGIERGEYTLDTKLTLKQTDYVDGAGQTNSHAAGTPLAIRYLLEQMIVYSDNTASDMLIGLVGIGNVNALVQSLVPRGFQPITRLADVRRQVYGQLDPAARRLSGTDFLLLKQQRSEPAQRQMLGRLLQVPVSEFRVPTVADAYDAYYATGLNSARLDAYGELLTLLANGKVLDPVYTDYLLAVMQRVKTGTQRIKAGLPQHVGFAHKTGTQSARTCDSGVISVPGVPSAAGPGHAQRIVVAACTRGDLSVAGSDRALRQVGEALCHSGLFSDATHHEFTCPAPLHDTGTHDRKDLRAPLAVDLPEHDAAER